MKKIFAFITLIILLFIIFVMSLFGSQEEEPKKNKNTQTANTQEMSRDELMRRAVMGHKDPARYEWLTATEVKEKFVKDKLHQLNWSESQKSWLTKATRDPTKENNALLYGAPGTGKTSIARQLTINTGINLVIINTEDLSVQDYEKTTVRQKLETTLKDIQNKHPNEDFIIVIEEADQIEQNGLKTKLQFLKGMMENIDPTKDPKMLFVLTTNHINDINPAVIRSGRLSLIEFNWTWKQLKDNGEKIGINWPQKYKEIVTLPPEKNQFVLNFSFAILNGQKQEDKRKSFKTYWDKFNAYQGEENNFDKIELEDFLNFFWDLRNSGDLPNWTGKFTFKRKGTLEEIVNAKLTEIKDQAEEIKDQLLKGDKQIMDLEDIKSSVSNLTNNLKKAFDEIGKLKDKVDPPTGRQTRIITPSYIKNIIGRTKLIENLVNFVKCFKNEPENKRIQFSDTQEQITISISAKPKNEAIDEALAAIVQQLNEIKNTLNL